MTPKKKYAHMTPRMALQLAAPHTWPGSIMPVFLAMTLSYAAVGSISISYSILLLIICILMQSSVNTFNDYFDFIKGADSADDNVESTDATLVYNDINPKSALILAICFLVIAFLLGIRIILDLGYIPLVIALIGALIVVLYSGGKTPISYLPIGEAVSGFVMGGLITLACYYVLTQRLDMCVLAWSIPPIIGIALIMLTNNTCDIEKDEVVSRNTLPVLLGRDRSVKLYHLLVFLWITAIIAIVVIWFTPGVIVVPFMLLAIYPFCNTLCKNPLTPHTRIGAMGQICNMNVMLGAFYGAAILASRMTLLI